MNKRFFLIAAFVLVTLSINAQTENSIEESVEINGVRWATCNVDAPGTFTKNPEDAGMYYQWNRKKAWGTTENVTDWDATKPEGSEWEKVNDPSPVGYRVPTSEEITSLLDTSKVTNEWITTENGVTGRKFTDIATGKSLFFPATGYRNSSNGVLGYVGSSGHYWSTTQNNNNPFALGSAYSLGISSSFVGMGYTAPNFGRSVRCVVE